MACLLFRHTGKGSHWLVSSGRHNASARFVALALSWRGLIGETEADAGRFNAGPGPRSGVRCRVIWLKDSGVSARSDGGFRFWGEASDTGVGDRLLIWLRAKRELLGRWPVEPATTSQWQPVPPAAPPKPAVATNPAKTIELRVSARTPAFAARLPVAWQLRPATTAGWRDAIRPASRRRRDVSSRSGGAVFQLAVRRSLAVIGRKARGPTPLHWVRRKRAGFLPGKNFGGNGLQFVQAFAQAGTDRFGV